MISGQCYVKEEKTFFLKHQTNDYLGKTFFNLYSKAVFVSSVGARKKKLYFIFLDFVFKQA